jgi:hypothetical protein
MLILEVIYNEIKEKEWGPDMSLVGRLFLY